MPRWLLVAFLFAVSVCAAPPAQAGLILITGSVSGEVENILFNEAGLIGTGVTVNGITQESDALVSFTEDSEAVTTPSGGQARVSGIGDDGLFDSLLFQAVDPLTVFLLFEANLNVTGGPMLLITATGSETVTFNLAAGNGQNRFGIVAENGDDFISSVLIQSLAGDAIADIRQVRVGGIGLSPDQINDVEPLVSAPEPGALVLLGSGLLGMAWVIRRKANG